MADLSRSVSFRRPLRWVGAGGLRGKVGASTVVHLLAVILIVNAWWIFAPRLKPAGTASGTRTMVVYTPAATAPSAAHSSKRLKQPRQTRPQVKAAPAAEQVAATSEPSKRVDPLGESSVFITYVQPFPAERPDLSGAGATGDVIVDLEIDEQGHISQLRTRRGMNAKIDAMVLATVERWGFRPAMRNGQPVTSQQELHFHYDHSRDAAGCGWDCFTLESQ